jgi:hypothetical protein
MINVTERGPMHALRISLLLAVFALEEVIR